MAANRILSCIQITIILTSCWIVHANHDSKRLYDDLIQKANYNKLVRPVGNSSDALVIKLGLKLLQVIDVVSMHSCSQHDLSTMYLILSLIKHDEDGNGTIFFAFLIDQICPVLLHVMISLTDLPL